MNLEMQGDNNINGNCSSSICSSSVSFCPSFNSYASAKLVDIAAKVSQDVERQQEQGNSVVNSGGGADLDFEFASTSGADADTCELFVDGQIRQVFPVFNRALLLNEEEEDAYNNQRKLRVSLKNLFIEERGGTPPPSSPSSSEDEEEEDELEGVPEETYCIWSPNRKAVTSSPNRSNSTGSTSSKGWFKFRDLLKLKRSNSEGKDSFIFLHKRKMNADSKAKQESSHNQVVKAGGKVKTPSAQETFYMKNRAIKEDDKKRSYLPYKQDLLGIFVSNVSSLGKTFAPF